MSSHEIGDGLVGKVSKKNKISINTIDFMESIQQIGKGKDKHRH